MMFGRLKEADLVSNREDKHGHISVPNVRETFFALGKGIREDFTWGNNLNCILQEEVISRPKEAEVCPCAEV